MKKVVMLAGLLASFSLAAMAAPMAETLPGDSVYQFQATLTDSTGRVFAWRDLRGQPRIVTMFYTSCRYICPLVVDTLRGIERQLTTDERERLGFVLVSMDPARDTPEALARVMSERHLDAAHWRLLQPRPDELRGLAGLLGIRYRSLADGEFNHSTALVLLDAEGRILARSERLGAGGDSAFLADVRAAVVPSGNASGR